MSLALAIGCVAAAAVALRCFHLATPLRRMIRALRADARRIDGEVEACDRVTADDLERLRAAARAYGEATLRGRREAVPVESLKDAGAKNVQWRALRAEGWTTLQDVVGRSGLTLQRVRGIGPTSAARVVEAARRVNERVEAEPWPLPRAELPDEVSRVLAARALDVLEGRDLLASAPRELRELAGRLRAQIAKAKAKAGFWRWLFGSQSAGHLVPEYYESRAVRAQVHAELHDGLLRDVAERRAAIIDRARVPVEDPELTTRFRARYAEACALIESVFPQEPQAATQEGLARRGIARHLPAEIVEAVNAFPLQADGLALTLRRYQSFGARYLLHQRQTILGDEMGLGKTIEALAAIVHCADAEGATHFLVVAPASITRNWQRETSKHTQLDAWLLHGSQREARLDAWTRQGGVALVSFATLRGMALDAHLKGHGVRIGFLVVDEAHYVKNPEAGRSQAVRAVLPRAERVCFMSGTPMENHPREFRTLIEALRPAIARKLASGSALVGDAIVEPDRFHVLVAPVYLRRNQEDVLRELPSKVTFEEWVEPQRAQLAAYREAVMSRNMMAMRRSVTVSGGDYDSAKMRRLAELLAEHAESGRKVLVFSFFLPVLDEVARRFGAIGRITGEVSADERMALIDRFGQADGHAVLACQIQAGGVGLNLQAASAVVLMEPQWKPSTEEQAIARAHRMGQTETVLVHRLLARDTVDERMVAILEGKLDLFAAYARESLIERASKAATEAAQADLVLAYETERLSA